MDLNEGPFSWPSQLVNSGAVTHDSQGSQKLAADGLTARQAGDSNRARCRRKRLVLMRHASNSDLKSWPGPRP